MARSPLPVIHHTTLTYIEGGAERTLEVGSSAWYAWLDAAAGFTYIGDAGTFTAHPEREARYWKAYRWVGGCRRRAYLGQAEGLSLERLAAAAAELAVSAPMAAGPQEPPGDSGGAVLGKVDAPPKARELAGALTSLPAPVGQLLGRQRERALARELLAGGARLLTLTGPGGVGKTRLAVALTGELNADLPDLQVAWADLTPLREPGLVPTAIAHAFGLVAWDARVPLAEALGARLHGQPALLVLDNCEQVLEGARAVGQLLDAVPELMVLATSREPLRLRAEQELPVPPLPLPYLGYGETLAQLAENPAVRLLVQRAQLVDPRFDLTESNARAVAEICVHLDGLPLAIELAAARTKLLPPEALLVRLDGWLDLAARARDIPHRHQTVRAAIDWSYDLLTAEEQAMFRRLAVFVGGCTIEAVATICAPGPDSDALDCLGALVDKNLVLREPDTVGADPRFRLLEPVRDYALDSLTASGEGPVTRERHARFFTELAQRVGGLVPDPTQVRHFAALEPEQANLRAALAWYLESGTTEAAEAGLRLTAPLAAFWWTYGSVEEGVRWCGVMLERAPVAGAPASLAWVKTAVGAGLLYMSKGEDERAQALLEHGLALARAEGWHHLVVEALDYLSSVALHRGEFDVARRWLEEALPLARAIGSSGWELTILSNLGRVLRQLGDTSGARTVSEQALVLSRLQPDPILAGRLVLQNLGRVAMQEGRLEDARAHFQAALQGLVQVRSSHLVAVCLEGLAGVAQQHGAWERAACLLGAAAGLHLATGEVEALPDRLARERVVESVRAHLGPARFEEFWGVGRTLHLEDAVAEALAIEACPAATQIKGGQLSGRERQVAALIAQGLTSAEIAERLVITPRTADTHADNIRSKLGLRSRTEIASWATAQGLSSPEAEHA